MEIEMQDHLEISRDLPERLLKIHSQIKDVRKSNKTIDRSAGCASAPSNIALVKYWGKVPKRLQIPTNSSLSFTLGGFRTKTKIEAISPSRSLSETKFSLNGKTKNTPAKVQLWLMRLSHCLDLNDAYQIESTNHFPTGCGIASSASGFAALAGAMGYLLGLDKILSHADFQYWLCEWARIGSGSASRSAFLDATPFVTWEATKVENGFTRNSGIQSTTFSDKLRHCVIVIDSQEKKISSSEGHLFAHSSPFFQIRQSTIENVFNQAVNHLDSHTSSFKTLRELSENDAILMHAIMQTGEKPAAYFSHPTANILHDFIKYRENHNIEALWTLDAGPNIHLLFTESYNNHIVKFLETIPHNCYETVLWNHNPTTQSETRPALLLSSTF